jgi:glycolate oxidase iron-sulfur subunit
MGETATSHAQAKRNIDAWYREIGGAGLDAIIVNTSGCGTTVKDYGFMFRDDPEMAERAAAVSALAKDITEFLSELNPVAPKPPEPLNVAYHSACSMQHGQGLKTLPVAMLRRAGFNVTEPGESHLCCGSAGTFNIMQPEIAAKLRDRKLDNIARTLPDVIATGNIGCMVQLAGGTDTPVVHTVELLDWAWGGPAPKAVGERE